MAIRLEQPGAAKAAATAGTMIGQGKRAEEDRARAQQEALQQQQIAAQQSARQVSLEWEQQKMLLNSQQDFAHQQRLTQARLDAEARAREWEVEKMELHSRMDFEQEEQDRLRYKAEYKAGRDVLEKRKGDMPSGEYESALFNFNSIYASKNVPDAVAGLAKPRSLYEQQYELLTPEEQLRKSRISAGIEARTTTPKQQTHRQKLLDITGNYYNDASLPELEEAAIDAGYDPRTYEKFDEAAEQIYNLGLNPTDFPTADTATNDTPESLRALGTKEAYEKGRQLGYWK